MIVKVKKMVMAMMTTFLSRDGEMEDLLSAASDGEVIVILLLFLLLLLSQCAYKAYYHISLT